MLTSLLAKGKATFVLGGQFGSCGKGAACAFLARETLGDFNLVTVNNGCQSGHTSIHNGQKRVLFHLPTYPVVLYDRFRRGETNVNYPPVYLNAGSIIDVDVLFQEIRDTGFPTDRIFIHPNAAIVTPGCKDAEGRSDSAQTKIASTRKGVGEALSRKVLRSGQIARDEPRLNPFIRRIDLNDRLRIGQSVLVEVPQGFSLGIDQPFYPHTTSRNCTVAQAASDAGIHPGFVGESMLVLRTKPIRVGNIENSINLAPDGFPTPPLGYSGGAYPGQRELSWAELGQTPEITTVTKRVRRVFEFSDRQLLEAMSSARPSIVFLAFCDYLKPGEEEGYTRAIYQAARAIDLQTPQVFYAYGPATCDVHSAPLARINFEGASLK